MRLCRLLRAAIPFCLGISAVRAEWIKLTTAHFEMYTTNPSVKALDALERFEQARTFFDENSPSETVIEEPVRIIAFDSEKEFRPYSPNPGAIAFYERGHGRDYIVMRDLTRGNYPVAIHEYTHLYLAHKGLHLPLWLNEGLADVYSTLSAKGDELILGAAPQGRWHALHTMPLLELHELTAVDEQSPYYRNPPLMQQFYSESWALAHMLLLGEQYSDGFRQFLEAVDGGKGTESAFLQVYKKSLREVTADLKAYLSQAALPQTSFRANDAQADVPLLSEVSVSEAELVLADLLSIHRDKAAEAEARLTGLAAESPGNPDVQKSLGYLAWQQGKIEAAEKHFEEALQAGSDDPIMMFRYASLLYAAHGNIGQAIQLLKRAVELKPDLNDARFSLGLIAATQGQCSLALSALSPIHTIAANRAFPLYSVLTFCNLKAGQATEARRWADLAEQYATTSQQRNTIEGWFASPKAAR